MDLQPAMEKRAARALQPAPSRRRLAVAVRAGERRRHRRRLGAATGADTATFDGTIYLLRDHALVGEELTGTFFKTDFKTLLYWRHHRSAETETVRECFGSSVIRSAEGHVLLGRQGPGQLNSGRIYPPSGLIDGEDVRAGASTQVLAQIPLTPGGLGFVEAGLTATLTLAGVPAGTAVVATFAYRLFAYWLQMPLGLVGLALQRAPAASARRAAGGGAARRLKSPARGEDSARGASHDPPVTTERSTMSNLVAIA